MSSPDQLVYKLIRSGVIISLDLVIENRIRIPASIRRAGKRDGLETARIIRPGRCTFIHGNRKHCSCANG